MNQITIPLVIGLPIPQDFVGEAIRQSLFLKSYGGLYTLNTTDCLPHITFYRGEFPCSKVEQIVHAVKTIADNTTELILAATSYRQSGFGYVDVAYATTKDIHMFQKKVVTILNPLREGLMTDSAKKHLHLVSKVQQKNFLTYGYDYVGNNFVPHLTFSKLKACTPNIESILSEHDFSFLAETIAVFEEGSVNTCKKVIEQFNLRKKICPTSVS